MNKPASLLAAALVLCLTLPSAADEITDQLDSARKAYVAGELRSSAQTLQFAVASIQERINLDLLKLLPEPQPGWQADDPQAQSAGVAAMIAGTNLSRRYSRGDGAEMEVSITADSPLLPMMTMMFSNPMMLQTSPGTKVYSYAGQRGVIEHEMDSDSWEISLLVDNKILIKVEGTGLRSKRDVEAYLKAVDLEAVRKAFAS